MSAHDIDVQPTGTPDTFDVTVSSDSGTTRHRVTVPDRAQAGLPQGVEADRLVRTSFVFLLEREPASAILPEFSLDTITRYFHEYPDEMTKRHP
ncbi:hypothetical protein ER308_11135 [Egibacter rhizosphaerae]|uniref:Uncharacterized protein n=1 Tax=Egibacter rhizosphaerae TaxID=1670831 RepID=A0A411YFQ5_9ACTN|nr:hypothetical protein [Egibacter rhizosphaerae]QBI20060.1 hypothetical protein ER308_11135 [Egibacter rhizosphaerae]